MKHAPPDPHAALARQRLPGQTLPREFFVDPAVHRRDVERLFLSHWIVVGHTASIPRPGDYFLYDIGFESLIVARDASGVVRAALNVCRHRGSRVAIEEYGRCQHFVCPLHGWTYALDGALQTAPNMPPDFDRADHGLATAQVEVVDGVVFVCLADPSEIAPLRRDVATFLAPYDLGQTRIAYHRRYLCPANWKLVAQCFLELHSSGAAYPQMRQVMSKAEASGQRDPDALRRYAEFAAEWRTGVRPLPDAPVSSPPAAPLDYSCRREPIRPGFVTQSEDGAAVAPLLGSQSASDGGVTVIRVLASWIVVCSDYAAIVRVTPLEAQVTEMDVTWLVRDSAVEGIDYDAPRLSWLWRANVERVLKLASDNQLGVNSTQYRPGPFAPDEAEIDAWVAWYLARLA